MMNDLSIEVVQVTHEHLEELQELWRADWLEDHPGDHDGASRAADDLLKSLAHFDFLGSDSFWLLSARVNDRFVGYATVVRVPKADARLLFLFVDELFVLKSFRRQGVGTALLRAVFELGTSLSAEGVRLVVESENESAGQLYKRCGFKEHECIFCERPLHRRT